MIEVRELGGRLITEEDIVNVSISLMGSGIEISESADNKAFVIRSSKDMKIKPCGNNLIEIRLGKLR